MASIRTAVLGHELSVRRCGESARCVSWEFVQHDMAETSEGLIERRPHLPVRVWALYRNTSEWGCWMCRTRSDEMIVLGLDVKLEDWPWDHLRGARTGSRPAWNR